MCEFPALDKCKGSLVTLGCIHLFLVLRLLSATRLFVKITEDHWFISSIPPRLIQVTRGVLVPHFENRWMIVQWFSHFSLATLKTDGVDSPVICANVIVLITSLSDSWLHVNYVNARAHNECQDKGSDTCTKAHTHESAHKAHYPPPWASPNVLRY